LTQSETSIRLVTFNSALIKKKKRELRRGQSSFEGEKRRDVSSGAFPITKNEKKRSSREIRVPT